MALKNVKDPLFYKYLLSYIFVLGLPIIIIWFTLFSDTLHKIEDLGAEANRKMISQLSERIDTEFSDMMKISSKLSYFTGLYRASPVESTRSLENRSLLNSVINSEFIDELIIYNFNKETLISDKTSYHMEIFASTYDFSQWTAGDVFAEMQQVTKPQLSVVHKVDPSGEKVKQFVYFVPIPINAVYPQGIAMFMIQESAITQLLQTTTNQQGNAFMTNASGKVLTSLNPVDALSTYAFDQLSSLENKTEAQFKYNDINYQAFLETSSFNGYHYVTIIPQEELMKDVHQIRDRGVIVLILILVIGSIIIFMLMKMNFIPLKELIKYAESKWGYVQANSSKGIGKIHDALQRADQLGTEMKEKLEKTKPALRQQMLGDLLRGMFDDVDTFNEAGKEIDIRLDCHPVEVAVIALPDVLESKSSILSKLESAGRSLPIQSIYVVSLIEQSRLAVIMQTGDKVKINKHFWTQFHEGIVEQLGVVPTIGVGRSSSELKQVPMSYLEASSALNEASRSGQEAEQVMMFESMSSLEDEQPQDHLHLDVDELRQLLLTGKISEARAFVSEYINLIMNEGSTLFRATCQCFDVLNTVRRTLYDMPGINQQFVKFPDIISLAQIDTIKELGNEVFLVVDDTLKQIESVISDDLEADMLKTVTRYLQDRMMDANFSIQTMAEELSWSPSHLRRKFKDMTGMTISNYVNELRMNKAKELLVETDQPVYEIVKRVGYNDVSSFIRKFKQESKMTPGEYRKAERMRNM
ncbi:helix-turn-helix transcriptional regulator [Bacillaceae bacterium SIJ1]|uniref:helix-turn-helix domain-containing protein n=1 Tax=Litoribacterium kuwaitense TaxID=1398745 RepID=UPI0013ED6341|nr:helix-turn-helix domain-containing protein [Litoribacterium kuwaitense]NGP45435.1 helix-turn-helix transcriptional regulator [Litoribacterium kuwaitense]